MEELVNYFAEKNEMKQYSSQIGSQYCYKCKHRDHDSTFVTYCSNDCGFKFTYRLRGNTPVGYYLVSEKTCLIHKQDCSNSTSNLNLTTDPRTLASKIAHLFESENPSIDTIKNCIRTFNKALLSESDLKYIKKLAREEYYGSSADKMGQLVCFCQNLSETHNWKFKMEFVEGMISSLILIPPWATHLITYFHSPFITDAKFSSENLRFIIGLVVDGENRNQLAGLFIRGNEDSYG